MRTSQAEAREPRGAPTRNGHSRHELAPVEARQQALIRLGGAEQTRQAHRERRKLPWIEDLAHDLRYGLRMMARNPSFTAVAVLTLAVGIGATTTAFTWIDAVMLQPLEAAWRTQCKLGNG